MELRQLEYFVAVAEEGSFTKAAARLYVTQPGVSAQVRRLEQELGQELLDRTGRTVRLTEVGAAVLAHARTALEGAQAARLVVDEFTGLMRGLVSVGVVRSCLSVDVPGLMAGFHARHQEVRIALEEENADRLLEGVQHGRWDAILVSLTGPDPEGLRLHVITDEPLVVAVAPDDTLVGRIRIGLEELRDRSFACLPPGTSVRTCLDRACLSAGFEPRMAFEVSDIGMLVRLAFLGLGPVVLPASVAAAYPRELRVLPIHAPELHGRMALAWRADGPTGPAARAFVSYACANLPTPADQESPETFIRPAGPRRQASQTGRPTPEYPLPARCGSSSSADAVPAPASPPAPHCSSRSLLPTSATVPDGK
ncbi:LysR family transcriptional regulator [Streptomyces sp. NPDC090499]|uniref:LysR family transcriptional regulator n=1 Tax=Streptomyces sp. NPDC090499 TaxID=3365965 RepID=UPI0037F11003